MTTLYPFQSFQQAFAAHARNPSGCPRPAGVPERRMRAYNELLFNNLSGFLDACFPVAREVLGPHRWARLARGFFDEWHSQTPYFREIPREFLRWLMSCSEDRFHLPAYLRELAHYEWAELAVDVMDAIVPVTSDWKAGYVEARMEVNPALMNLAYQWPVHRIGPRHRPRKQQATNLLVYRKSDDSVAFMEINPVTARLVALLQEESMTGREVLGRIAKELEHPDPDTLVQFGVSQLEALWQEEVLLGAAK
jgi:hypothetical protein